MQWWDKRVMIGKGHLAGPCPALSVLTFFLKKKNIYIYIYILKKKFQTKTSAYPPFSHFCSTELPPKFSLPLSIYPKIFPPSTTTHYPPPSTTHEPTVVLVWCSDSNTQLLFPFPPSFQKFFSPNFKTSPNQSCRRCRPPLPAFAAAHRHRTAISDDPYPSRSPSTMTHLYRFPPYRSNEPSHQKRSSFLFLSIFHRSPLVVSERSRFSTCFWI
jgi:hypothetical protein